MERQRTAEAAHFLPAEHPLAMPVQSLFEPRPASARPSTAPISINQRRALVFGLAAAIAGFASWQMYWVLEVGGLTGLETAILVLFSLLNSWLAISLASAIGGLVSRWRRSDSGLSLPVDGPLPALTQRTAVLMPTYNEDPARVFAGLQATYESLRATGAMATFDFFLLSDTTQPDIWIAEEAELLALRARLAGGGNVFYRRRARNIDRKAGNVAEWVRRFGGGYESMVVLDADSIMSGETIVRLAAAMEQHPGVGLIQTLPLIINGQSLFARAQQFASRLNGPLIARGIAWWHGADGNFWGHNAIIRVSAFAAEAGLPHLRGRKPFGGHILSHDFVEAALLRRGGWAVHMAPELGGSFEEGPPTLADVAIRDRRWCQGNLQHARVLRARGLAPISRSHLLFGIASYLTSPLLLTMILIGLAASLQARFIPPDYFPAGYSLFPSWPVQDPIRAAWVFVGTLAILMTPKFLALGETLLRRRERLAFGGGWRLLGGFFIEAAISALLAPIAMIDQTFAVTGILLGRDAGWNPQRRDDGLIAWSDTLRRYLPHTLIGLALAGAAFAISLPLFFWMLPVAAGLVFAMPLTRMTAGRGMAELLARMGLLTTPEERDEPEVLRRARVLRKVQRREASPEALLRLTRDADLLAAHRLMLPRESWEPMLELDAARLLARAKMESASTLETLVATLTASEKAAALGDPICLDTLMKLARYGSDQTKITLIHQNSS